MEIFDIIRKRRSIRSFTQEPVSTKNLKLMIEMARLAPSAANLQPVSYICVNTKEYTDKIFPLTRWAGYTAPKGVPTKEDAPTAYIVVLVDDKISPKWGDFDGAYASENIVLSAEAMGISSCILGAVDKEEIKKMFNIEDNRRIHTVIALGYANQTSDFFDMEDNFKYSIDDNNNFKVPKRKTEDICKFV